MNRINPFLLTLSISILLGGDTFPGKDIQSQINYSQEISVNGQKDLNPANGQKPGAERQEEMDSFRKEMKQKHAEMINQFPDVSPRIKQAFNQKTLQNNKSSSFDPKSFKLKMKSNSRSERGRPTSRHENIESNRTVQSSSSSSKQLKNKYKYLFNKMNDIIYMKVPNFSSLQKWRLKQENKLRLKNIKKKSKIMTNSEVLKFMMTYQRVAQQMFKDLPKIASIILNLNKNHQIKNIRYIK